MMRDFIFKKETYKIIGCCMEVHRELGSGLLEAVYQEALEVEFCANGIPYVREQKLVIKYKEKQLQKKYKADFVCYDKIIVELKAVECLVDIHMAQVINYLKITNMSMGLLVNFAAPSLEFKRIIN